MSPDQIQQLMNQQMQMAAAATPLWMKALFLLQILSLLATVICLPLITWKLFSSGKRCLENENPFDDNMRLREIRAKREALEKLSATSQSTITPQTVARPTDDSRFRPPQ